MFLEYLNTYCLRRTLSATYTASLGQRLKSLERWYGKPMRIKDLHPDLVSSWILHLQEEGRLGPKSIKEYRAAVIAVWREAYEDRLTDIPPTRVRRVKVPRLPVCAWTIDEIRLLLAEAHKLAGWVPQTQIPRALWWDRFLRLAWHTGLRISDIIDLEASSIDSDGILRKVAHKTGVVVTVRLRGSWVASLPRAGKIAPWPGSKEKLFREFRGLVARAGIRPGTTRWLRRSAASYTEKSAPGAATALLGHLTQEMARRHYLDLAITGQIPPPLEEL